MVMVDVADTIMDCMYVRIVYPQLKGMIIMTDYEVLEFARRLQGNGFSKNASAAVLMWMKYHNKLESPYLFTYGDFSLYDALDKFISELPKRYKYECIDDSNYSGNVDIQDGISLDRFKTGFIDVMTLSYIFENSYDGGEV